MEYRFLPNTDIKISQISLGCMSFHNEREGRPIIETALELGVNFFDTADLYDKGENEKILGKVLAEQRQNVVIATKVGNRWRNDGSGWDWVPRKKYILDAVEASLSRLNTDYIDLYQLHGGTIEDPLDEVLETFERLKEQGKIRAYGISSIRPNTIRKWTTLGKGVSCMSQYSLLDRRPEAFILDYLNEHEQKMLVRGALAKGLLAGKKAKEYLNWTKEEVAHLQQALCTYAGSDLIAPLAMQFILGHPSVASIVLGASTAQQFKNNVNGFQQASFSKEKLPELAEILGQNHYQNHLY